jgi:hypothetical protein
MLLLTFIPFYDILLADKFFHLINNLKGECPMTKKLDEIKNDRVDGLKAKVSLTADGKKKTSVSYTGKYGQGYDGCGTHTHK